MADIDESSRDERYSRQRVLPEIGDDGQEKLGRATVVIIGCGALGCMQAQLLARAGIGNLRIVDRDTVERNNLQRQLLFDEQDAAALRPKSEAAARKLSKINSSIHIEGIVVDAGPRNIELLLSGAEVVLDGTDNFETRYLINDACLEHGLPWIYGGVIGTTGMSMPVIPGSGPCLRCLFPTPPAAGSQPTCDTAGVLNSAPAVIAAVQVSEVFKIIVGNEISRPQLYIADLWNASHRMIPIEQDPSCPGCGHGRRDFLRSREHSWTTSLCGRNAVQVTPPGDIELDLAELQERLSGVGRTVIRGRILELEVDGMLVVVFPDGRAIVRGTLDTSLARSLYARYLGI